MMPAHVWPWRGLGLATALAVGIHVVLALWASQDSLSRAAGAQRAASLNTRWVASSAPPSLPVAAVGPAARSRPLSRSIAAAMPERVAPLSSAEAPLQAEQNELKIAPALSEYTLNATENIASEAHLRQVNSGHAHAMAAPTSEPTQKIAYPPAVALQFEGVFMSRGVARSGTGVLQWASDGQNYELSLQASALLILSRTEKSVGILGPYGLTPTRYSSSRTGRSEQATHFRADTGRIQFSTNKPDEALLAGAQDRLSVLMQLAGLLAGEPQRYQSGDKIQLWVAGLDSAQMWEFVVEGRDAVNLPSGPIQATKLRRTHRHEYDQSLELWLAPEWSYLPVRILQSARAAPERDFTDLLLSKMP